MKIDILGVKIDNVNLTEVLSIVEKWIWNPGPDSRGSRTNVPINRDSVRISFVGKIRREKHYIVTPNLEFILAAQADPEFKRILNRADLAIPDSSSLGFSSWLLKKNILIRLALWPLFFVPLKQLMHFDRISGTDLTEALCRLSAEKGFVTGFLGGRKGVAERCAERLRKKYPKLKVAFAESGGEVDDDGRWKQTTNLSSNIKIMPLDILFVAFGHIKQEKWIVNNLENIPVKLAIGVGGAFDYLSGDVFRAPLWIRSLGFEWLFRLIVQPWRIKRQLALLRYVWLLITFRKSVVS